MADLNSWNLQYHSSTADFPISVLYFKPLRILPSHSGYSRHIEPEFMLIHRGRVELRTPDNRWDLQAGDIVFIHPHELHSFRAVDMDVLELCVRFFPEFVQFPAHHYFQKNFLNPLMNGTLRMPTVIRKDHPAYERVYHALSQLHPSREETPGYQEELLMTVMSVCCIMAPYCTAIQAVGEFPKDAVAACVAYLHKNYTQKLSLDQLSRHLGVHPNYLCSRFREVVGKSIFTYIHDLRLENAKWLLSTTRLSVAEVAQRCGYNDLGFFREKFKKSLGMSPKEYHKAFYKPNA